MVWLGCSISSIVDIRVQIAQRSPPTVVQSRRITPVGRERGFPLIIILGKFGLFLDGPHSVSIDVTPEMFEGLILYEVVLWAD